MQNQGFTLIELIGVIVLLSLLVLIFAPTVEKVIKDGQEKTEKQLEENIILAARNWSSDNKTKIPTTLTLKQLQEEGYIDKNIKNPKTNKKLTNACVEIISINNENYDYKYQKDCQ